MITLNKKCFKPWMIALLASIPMMVGCGDSSHNDQGVSFTALGWYSNVVYVEGSNDIDKDGEAEDASVDYSNNMTNQDPLVSASVPLSTDKEKQAESGAIMSYIGLQNNLAAQIIRTERAYHEYYVPGASVQPPSTSVSVNAVLGYSRDSREDQDFGADSSLPEYTSDYMTNNVFAKIPIVTSDVRTFINMNLDSMPEPPFVMIVNTVVEGVTSAGARIKTNSISFDVYWTTPNVITPTQGDDEEEEEDEDADDDVDNADY